jgi:HK97 gp10 family phage protein
MRTLNDVAKKVTSLAQLNLTRGATKAYKTGNLYRNIGSYNTPNRVLGNTKIGQQRKKLQDVHYGVELNLVYNPPGADYGKYVEEGTEKMDARPFAEEAMNDPSIIRSIEEYLGLYVEENVVPSIMSELDKFDTIE